MLEETGEGGMSKEPENENDEWERLRWRDHAFRRQEAQAKGS